MGDYGATEYSLSGTHLQGTNLKHFVILKGKLLAGMPTQTQTNLAQKLAVQNILVIQLRHAPIPRFLTRDTTMEFMHPVR